MAEAEAHSGAGDRTRRLGPWLALLVFAGLGGDVEGGLID